MILVVRLFFVACLGVALFVAYTGWIEPQLRIHAAPQSHSDAPRELARIFGQYAASTKEGNYVLILDRKGAELRFTDSKQKEHAYRGRYVVDGSLLEIEWREARQGQTWSAIRTIIAKLEVDLPAIRSPQATFQRVDR